MDVQDYRELIRLIAREQRKTHAHAWFVTGEEHLRLTVRNSVASARVVLRGRFLGVDATIRSLEEGLTPATDRSPTSATFALGEGVLLNAQLLVTGATPRRGQTLALLELVRGLGGDVVPLATLLAGYVTDTQRLAWPGSPLRHSAEGPGVIRSITGTDPAANTEISETVPTDARWRPLSVSVEFVTDANVADRDVRLVLDDGTTVYADVPQGVNQAASQTRRHTWALVGARGAGATSLNIINVLPAVQMTGGHRITTVTNNRQVGDNFGAPQLLVEEWIED